jgi:soluble lytic murein transglycosylase-like protein
MIIARCLVLVILGSLAPPANAQVIEIGADGEATVYDAPTIFADEGSSPVYERATYAGQPLARSAATTPVAQVEREYGLPSGIVDAVIYQESRGRMNAVSPKGALGLMQLMPGTAAQLGVNPYDADQNIRGGARYLRQQIDRFGSIPLALAAYNAGPGAVTKYGGIPPYRETQNYVATILSRWQPPALPTIPAAAAAVMPVAPIINDTVFFIEVTEP